ncbi:mannose-1-phosphate guanylyltransferase [Roseibium sp. Sym1]|uniref:mannose-1-phosphate guanylyltransferase n=1 Tax=Roseibium sp. Sym1 TaxID=3016006 RepID=UPI0022B43DB3|nr:sugar phosphate nucleotidyltransferase [Roseibium sp. Sym1]
MPKQFLRLTNEKSLFQNTLSRVDHPVFTNPWFLTTQSFVDLVDTQADEVGSAYDGIILEPLQRGTAAALAVVALKLAATDPEALVLAMPADHVVGKPENFVSAVERAIPIAEDGKIVTFGIVPKAPETGFGYIRPADPYLLNGVEIGALVRQPGGFLEKPDRERAEQFVEAGYYWNAGIFLFKASVLADELRKHAPETHEATSRAIRNGENRPFASHVVHMPCAEDFARCPDDVPIDIAVMEKSDCVAVVPCNDIDWADIGSLSALWEISDKDDEESCNVLVGDTLVTEARNCFVHSQAGRKVVLGHVEDMVVIDSEDTVVVLPRHQAQRVKDIVKTLKATNAKQVKYSRSATRTWGTVSIDRTFEGGQVCAVTIKKHVPITYRVAGAAHEVWMIHGDGSAEYSEDGTFKPFLPGVPVSFSEGQVVTLRNTTGHAEFTYVRSSPDLDHAIEDWFPQVAEVELAAAAARFA